MTISARPDSEVLPEQRTQALQLDELRATPCGDAQLAYRKRRLEVRVRIGIPEELHQRPQDPYPLAHAMIRFETGDVIQGEGNASSSFQVLGSVYGFHEQARHSASLEQSLVVLRDDGKVTEAQHAVATNPRIRTSNEADQLGDHPAADEVRLRVALRREQSQRSRRLLTDLDLTGAGMQNSQREVIQYSNSRIDVSPRSSLPRAYDVHKGGVVRRKCSMNTSRLP